MPELRLRNLKKRFIKDEQYHEDYTRFVEDMIKKGYAENSDPKANQQRKTQFIPDHGVYHPSKPGEIRVVFDCSGVSVNKRLLSGSDLTNQIAGIVVWQSNVEVYLVFFGGKIDILKSNYKSTI